MAKEIVIKPHHLADLVFGTQPEGVIVKWEGYDGVHDREMQSFHQEMLDLPPETVANFTLGPDRNCKPCPLNILGERFDPDLAAKDHKGPCDPFTDCPEHKEKMYIRWLYEKTGSEIVTLEVLPRKTWKQFEKELTQT